MIFTVGLVAVRISFDSATAPQLVCVMSQVPGFRYRIVWDVAGFSPDGGGLLTVLAFLYGKPGGLHGT